MRVEFTVLGVPVGKGRPRFSNRGGFVKTYTPEKTANYETLVKFSYQEQCKGFSFSDDTELGIEIKAYFPIPKSTTKKKAEAMRNEDIRPTKKPDADNILKAICDSLNDIAYHDDSQIVSAQINKFYSDKPRAEIIIWEERK